MAVARALISVFDKTGIVEFAKRLAALQLESPCAMWLTLQDGLRCSGAA